MNKLKFLFTLLCAVVGMSAWAQTTITTLDELSNGKVYNIQCGRGYMPNGDGTSQLYGTTDVTKAAKWAFVKSPSLDNTYYIYSADHNMFLKSAGVNYAVYSYAVAGTFTLTENDGTFIIASTQTTNWLQLGSSKQYLINDSWKIKDDGNQWTITEAGDLEDAMLVMSRILASEKNIEFEYLYGNLNTVGGKRATEAQKTQLEQYLYDGDYDSFTTYIETLETISLSNTKIYAIKSAMGAIYWDSSTQPEYAYSTGKSGVAIDHNSTAQQWAIQVTDKGKYLYNIGAGKFAHAKDSRMALDVNLAITTTGFEIVDNKANSACYPWVLKFGNSQISVNNSYDKPVITSSNSLTAPGNQFRLVEVGDYDNTDVMAIIDGLEQFAAAQAVYESVSVATGCVGSYNATAEQVAALKTALDNRDVDACKSLIAAIGEKITFNNRTVYSIKNNSLGSYLMAKDDGLLWSNEKAGVAYGKFDPNQQWMIYNDGNDTILYNIGQGGWANDTKGTNGYSKHWQIVKDQSAISYVDVLDYGPLFSIRDKDWTGDRAFLHINTGYTTDITNWYAGPSYPASVWLFYPVMTLSEEITESMTTLQAFSESIKGLSDTYNNLNTVGGKRASAEQQAHLEELIENAKFAEAVALVASLEDCTLSNQKKYIIETTKGAIYWDSATQPEYAYSTKKSGVAIDHNSTAQQWAIQVTDKGKYLFNIGASKFAYEKDDRMALDVTAYIAMTGFDIVDNKSNSQYYPWVLKFGNNQISVDNSYNKPVITSSNSLTAPGNQFRLVEVGDYDNTDVMAVIDGIENPAVVTVNHKLNGEIFNTTTEYVIVGSEAAASWQPACAIPANSVGVTANLPMPQTVTGDKTVEITYTYDATALPFEVSDLSDGFKNDTKFYTLKIRNSKNVVYNQSSNRATDSSSEPGLNAGKYFAFAGDNINGFKIYNLAAGADKTFGSDDDYGYFTAEGQLLWFENNDGMNIFHAVNTENKYVNDNNSKFAYWISDLGATDIGGHITFVEADATDLLISAKQTFLSGVTQVTTTGEIGDYSQVYVDDVDAALSATATLEDVIAVTTTPAYRLPATNAFYRIKGAASDKYVSSLLTDGRPQIADQSADVKGTIWYLDENNTLINYKAGMGLKDTRLLGAYNDTFNKWTFAHAAAGIPYLSLQSDYTGAKYLCDWTDGAVDCQSADAVANRTAWTVEPVTAIPVTIGSTGYASVSLPVATTIPSGVEAWAAGEETDGKLVLNKVKGNVLPAGCAVILYSDAPATYDFETTDAIASVVNMFSGTIAAQIPAEGMTTMVLGNSGGEVGLYKYTGAYIPGFKMYYETTVSEVRMQWNYITTAIDAAKRSDLREGEMYNINGQQVTKANGLVIVNGKKIVVK